MKPWPLLLVLGSSICTLHTAENDVGQSAALRVERNEKSLRVFARRPGTSGWSELLTYVMDPDSRPYLHPVRDPSGRQILTDNRPTDHPWQHGIFTGFHRVNGFNYWKEDEGRQRFVRLMELEGTDGRAAWRSLTELVAPGGQVILEEEQTITVFPPVRIASAQNTEAEGHDAYVIDFDFLLRAQGQSVDFRKFGVGGLAVRMPWDETNPRHTHLNSNGLLGRACEQKRAQWCNVERPFGGAIFGIAVFDHPTNPNHPAGWRVDEQGLINPALSMLGDWTLPAKTERRYRHRILVYQGRASREWLDRQFKECAAGASVGANGASSSIRGERPPK